MGFQFVGMLLCLEFNRKPSYLSWKRGHICSTCQHCHNMTQRHIRWMEQAIDKSGYCPYQRLKVRWMALNWYKNTEMIWWVNNFIQFLDCWTGSSGCRHNISSNTCRCNTSRIGHFRYWTVTPDKRVWEIYTRKFFGTACLSYNHNCLNSWVKDHYSSYLIDGYFESRRVTRCFKKCFTVTCASWP